MAPSSSSTKKAARLTQRGKGSKVRFQGGTLFPLAVALAVVLGLGTIVYARQSQPAADASPPSIDDHWHAAYGFYLCGEWYQLQGAKEELNSQGQLANSQYLATGVHSHDDGVIHWHAFTSRSVGRNADLGVFLDVYEVEVDSERIEFPAGQPIPAPGTVTPALEEYVEGETQCDGDDAEVQVVAWDLFTDTGGGTTYITDFDDIRLRNDGMVFGIAFVPRDTDIPMPPWAADLPALGAIDSGTTSIEDLAPNPTTPDGGTDPGQTDATVPDTSEPATDTTAG